PRRWGRATRQSLPGRARRPRRPPPRGDGRPSLDLRLARRSWQLLATRHAILRRRRLSAPKRLLLQLQAVDVAEGTDLEHTGRISGPHHDHYGVCAGVVDARRGPAIALDHPPEQRSGRTDGG